MAVQLAEDLVHRFPDEPVFRDKLADVYDHVRGLRDAIGPFSAKRDAILKAQEQLEHLARIDPAHPSCERRLAESYQRLGSLERQIGTPTGRLGQRRVDVAIWDERLLERARLIQQQLVDGEQQLPWVAIDLSNTFNMIAILQFDAADYTSFREHSTSARALLQDMIGKFPDVERLNLDLATLLIEFAKYELSLQFYSAALPLFEMSADHYRIYLTKRPQSATTYLDLTASLILAGRCAANLGEPSKALGHFKAANDTLSNVHKLGPCPPHLQDDVQELQQAITEATDKR